MFKGRLGVWIFALLLAIGGPWLCKQLPIWLHTDNVVVTSELQNIDMLDAISQQKYGHFKVHTTTETPDVIFSTDNTNRDGYRLVENAIYSPLVLYVVNNVDNYENGFIQDDEKSLYLRINLHTILTAMENNQTWQDIGIHKKVLEGKVSLNIPDEHDWCYPYVKELFYLTINGGIVPTEEQRQELSPRIDALLTKCHKCPSIAQAISDEAENPSDGYKAFIAPEYLYTTCEGMGESNRLEFVPVYFTKTISMKANAYLRTGYSDVNLSEGFMDAIRSNKEFMRRTGWRVKDSTFNITKTWSRFPNVI